MSGPVPLHAAEAPLPAGVSLVTSSKNRNGNLVRAITSWLAHPQISEIVIVDWCSDTPVVRDLAKAGIDDPRIRIARVYDEPRWILSYAFNVGFRLARFDQILKCDADIVLADDYFDQNTLEQGRFIAGNWRNAGAGQEFVNGFFHTHTADLMGVNGFNEYITTYGWDDDDLYDRLIEQGTQRQDVAIGTVSHLDHEDVARLNDRGVERQTAWSDLNDSTMFKIRTNRFIATIMPRWVPDLNMRPYVISPHSDGTTTVRRAGPTVHEVPNHITETAKRLAAYELVSWRAGVRTFGVSEERFDLLLSSHRLETLSPLLVELALSDVPVSALSTSRALVVEVSNAVLAMGGDALDQAAAKLARLAFRTARLLVVSTHGTDRPTRLTGALALAPYIPAHVHLGDIRNLPAHDVRRDPEAAALRVVLQPDDLHHLPPCEDVPTEDALAWVRQSLPAVSDPYPGAPAPMVQTGRRSKLYIDAQHGLGNRLRAIGSAYAVAQNLDRELVVIWEPDHHCQGRLADLFEYSGAVEDISFADHARQTGALVTSYMEIEDGAVKDAPLTFEDGRDAYIRSAYVLNHPASRWETENRLLQRLRPSRPVLDLLAQTGDAAHIGLHVRMEGAPGTDHNSYDAAENWTEDGHAAIHHWREKSHYKHFMARLDDLLKETPEARVFLAADQADTYRAFEETYGDRIGKIERDLYDRSAAQLQFALADMVALSRTRHLLGSNWSSFTEAALRLSTTIKTREIAGQDF